MALFYEAECQRLQQNMRTASETYTKLLTDFPRTRYTPAACGALFEIADHWLEPTRKQMDEYQEQLQGKRTVVLPTLYVHVNRDMPMLDPEGNALLLLHTIYLHDVNGKMAEQALLYLGTINFYRGEYKEADFYFSELREKYKDGPYAAKAIKQSIICKQLSTGGSMYDSGPIQQSKDMIMKAQATYKDFADDKWIETQLKTITIQQADRDFNIAEFYKRTGHPGAAYFYYELVKRRYPGTSYANQANERINTIRAQVERERARETQAQASTQTGGPGPAQNPTSPLPPPVDVAPPDRLPNR
jgi:outer membrane protein assembly factor BamD (BamD/ComL family)